MHHPPRLLTNAALLLVLSSASLLLGAPRAFGQERMEEKREEEESEQARRADVPQAVEAAFRKKYPQAEIVGTDVEHENGSTFYEVESRNAGFTRDLLYRPDGHIYEIEEQIGTDALPQAVRQAAEEHGQIVKAERISRGSTTEYEVAVRQGGEAHEMVLNAKGQVIERSEEED